MKFHRYDAVPEIEEIAPELYRIVVPQPFYDSNNIYLINSGEPALIDCGYAPNLGLLQRALQKVGLSLSKLRHIFFTHDHIDHISAALTLRFYTSAKLYGMVGMARAVGNYVSCIQIYQRAMDRLIYKAHQDPRVRRDELDRSHRGWSQFLTSVDQGRKLDPVMRMDIELVEGDVIPVGRREVGFLHTPGHNCWHLTPYILGEGIYFTGDAALENISSIYAEIDGNLQDYHNSLERLARLPIKRLLPAHGQEPEDPRRRLRLLLKTLALMERGVLRRLKENPHDLGELVSASMGEKVKEGGHYITALGVMHAIIQKLIAQKQVEVDEVDPPYERYRWTGGAGFVVSGESELH